VRPREHRVDVQPDVEWQRQRDGDRRRGRHRHGESEVGVGDGAPEAGEATTGRGGDHQQRQRDHRVLREERERYEAHEGQHHVLAHNARDDPARLARDKLADQLLGVAASSHAADEEE
jgi:hypothetical protein